MESLDLIYKDIKELENPIKRVPGFSKAQMFGNEFINIYFLRSGFEAPAEDDKVSDEYTRYYYVIIENEMNPVPPSLMTPAEIKEKLNVIIDDYY